jgi:glutamine---fructose-6-phosphate transaminase (isomerizing)
MTPTQPTSQPKMLQEVKAAPAVIARMLAANREHAQAIASAITERQPHFAYTIARGSSDHASNLAKYALETQLGLVTASAAPSVVTVYGVKPRLERALVLAISQSGQSPDVVQTLVAARESGAITVAIVNAPDSPLEAVAEFVLPMQAGPEQAVAATKSFVASLVAPLQIVAALQPTGALAEALAALPAQLEATLALEQIAAARAERYRYAESLVTLARGAQFPVALELALKLKETSRLRAEAFSAAEFAHGPIILIEEGFPVLALLSRDAAAERTATLYRDLAARGAELILLGAEAADIPAAVRLVTPATGHFLTDAVPSVIAGYLLAGHLALARGLDPDAPRTLSKVTRTL